MTLGSKINGLRQIFFFDNRWQLFLDRLIFRRTKLNVYRLGNFEFIVDHSAGDANGTRHVIASDMYKRLVAKINLKPSISVIDCGANGGGLPLMLKSMGFDIQRLVCIEMNPNTFHRLEFNIRHNFDCDTKLINAAICGNRRTFFLNLGRGSTSDSLFSLNKPIEGKTKCFSISGYLFDEIYEMVFNKTDVVDICKMDIEGAEYEVFLNDGHQSLSNCQYLIIEIHNLQEKIKTILLFDEMDRLNFIKVEQYENVFLYRNKNFVME